MEVKAGWYTPKEIMKFKGMPGTVQGVHKRAKREGWIRRRRDGVRGPAVEYNIYHRVLKNGTVEHNRDPLVCSGTSGSKEMVNFSQERIDRMILAALESCSSEEKLIVAKQLLEHGMVETLEAPETGAVKELIVFIQQLNEREVQQLLAYLKNLLRSFDA